MITGWESPEVLEATLADTWHRFARQAAAEHLTVPGPVPGVAVVIGADGFLVAVEIAQRARRGRTAGEMAGIVADAVRAAERAAADRRRELAAALEEQ